MIDGADETRARLLEAAGQVFAEKGFEGATIREICARAGANVAAVNYHFRDKESLYIEAVRLAHCEQATLSVEDLPAGLPPEEQLVIFIREMMKNMIDVTRPDWQLALVMREMARPSRACEELVKSFIGPRFAMLEKILEQLLPPDLDARSRHLHAFSVVGQCLLYRFHRPVGRLLVGDAEFDSYTTPDLIADHIADFSLRALGRAWPRGAGGGP